MFFQPMQFENMFTFLKMFTTPLILKINGMYKPYPTPLFLDLLVEEFFHFKSQYEAKVNPSPGQNCEQNSKLPDLEGPASHG